jgi:hypothetical protein
LRPALIHLGRSVLGQNYKVHVEPTVPRIVYIERTRNPRDEPFAGAEVWSEDDQIPSNGRPAEFPPLDGPLFHIPGNGRYNESGEIPGRIPVVELPLKDSQVAVAPSMNGTH